MFRSAAVLFCLVLSIGIIRANAVAADDSSVSFESDTKAHDHPLDATLQYARARAGYIRQSIRDYSGRLIKRERIDGRLQSYQFIDVKMRCKQERDDHTIPMAVFLRYLGPKSLKGRRVLFVEGENNGRMLVRKGGVSLQHVKLRIDPFGSGARRESNYPITDIGFDKMIERLIDRLVEDMESDPEGINTKVASYGGARVGDRTCTRIEVIHPKHHEGAQFHQANLFVDDILQLPIRLTVHTWPEKEGEEPRLIEEYTYVNLAVNVGFGDEDFDPSLLDSPSSDAVARSRSDD